MPLRRTDGDDPQLLSDLLDVVTRIAASGELESGDEVAAFEREFADYCGAPEAIGVASGTDALTLGLRAIGLRPGDEVVVPANSHIATAEAVTRAGGVPRFADVDPRTQLVTAETVERALGGRTRHVIAVHLYGRTVDLDPLLELAAAAGVTLIEDACQAPGAWYGEKRVGSFGAFAAFSFNPASNLGAWGDAGAVTTSDSTLAERVRLLRAHGEDPHHHHQIVGTSACLDALQAGILRVKLARLDTVNAGCRAAAQVLTDALAATGLELPPPAPEGHDHVYQHYVVTTVERDDLRDRLARNEVDTGIHYPVPIHRTPAYSRLRSNRDPAPVATDLAGRLCSLPLYPGLDAMAAARIAAAVSESSEVSEMAQVKVAG